MVSLFPPLNYYRMIRALKTTYNRYSLSDFSKILIAKFFRRFNTRFWGTLLDEENKYLLLDGNGLMVRKRGKYVCLYKNGWDNLCISLRPYSSDVEVFCQIFINDEFKELIKLIGEQNKINVIIDAGANIGLSSIKFKTYFPDAMIIPIEPDEENYKTMLKNLKENNINALPIKAGVWNKPAKLYFNRSFRDGKEWSISLTDIPDRGKSIDSVSINEIVKKNNLQHIDLLKIDIEGSEKQLFKNNNSDVDFLDITKFIAIEIHNELNIKEHIENILKERGFSLSESGEYLIGKNRFLTVSEFSN